MINTHLTFSKVCQLLLPMHSLEQCQSAMSIFSHGGLHQWPKTRKVSMFLMFFCNVRMTFRRLQVTNVTLINVYFYIQLDTCCDSMCCADDIWIGYLSSHSVKNLESRSLRASPRSWPRNIARKVCCFLGGKRSSRSVICGRIAWNLHSRYR